MQSSLTLDLTALSAGLLAFRLVTGLAMAAHGTQKLFGWFGGPGLTGTAGFFEKLGFRPGRTFALAASTTEILGGLLVATGLLGPIGPALMISVMVVAMVTVHWPKGFFAQSGGIELPLLYSVAAIVLAFAGYGEYSLDAALGADAFWTPAATIIALTIGLLGGLGSLMVRHHGSATPSTAR